jgi:cell division protein FtsB
LPRPRFTARAAVLVLVLAVLVVSYASSLRAYFQQRHQIQSLQDNIRSSQEHITALQREKKRWGDDAYVIAQARARFAFGFPGEIGYQVLDVDGKPLDHVDSLTDPTRTGDGRPEWWQTTLTSIDTAGHPPHVSAPVHRVVTPAQPSTGQ